MKKVLALMMTMVFLLSACGKEEQTYRATAGKPVPEVKTVKMAVVGDIMVHDYQYNEAYDPATDTYDFMHNFQDVKQYFAGNDLVIGNLELTFGYGQSRSDPHFGQAGRI